MPAMQILRRLAWLLLLVAAVVGARWLWVGSRVGAGFAAHVLCSLDFVSGQSPAQVVEEYVQYEAWPLGMALSFDEGENEITARLFGMPRARAVYREERGCTLLDGGREPHGASGPDRETAPSAEGFPEPLPPLDAALPWPAGNAPPAAPAPRAVEAAIDRAFAEPGPEGYRRVTKAVVIAHDGQLVAERYAPGYAPSTRMLSWSMAKSVLATLVGLAIQERRLDLDSQDLLGEWRDPADARRRIRLDQLLRMSSGLSFDESYGATSEASVMLFARPDAAAYAAGMPLAAPPGEVWSYSSGTANILARVLGERFDGTPALLRWARERLFAPAGLHSALLEADASGTLLASSFVFMTARDWARFGELHRRGGLWQQQRVLPEGWVEYVTTPTPASNGEYGAHWWLNRGTLEDPDTPNWPELPPDSFAAWGHNGQYVLVVPSEKLVVVRLGLSTPADGNDGAQQLAADVIRHYRGGVAASGG